MMIVFPLSFIPFRTFAVHTISRRCLCAKSRVVCYFLHASCLTRRRMFFTNSKHPKRNCRRSNSRHVPKEIKDALHQGKKVVSGDWLRQVCTNVNAAMKGECRSFRAQVTVACQNVYSANNAISRERPRPALPEPSVGSHSCLYRTRPEFRVGVNTQNGIFSCCSATSKGSRSTSATTRTRCPSGPSTHSSSLCSTLYPYSRT